MKTIDMVKVRSNDGIISSVVVNGQTRGVALMPVGLDNDNHDDPRTNFLKLIGYCLSNGAWTWVHKDFVKKAS